MTITISAAIESDDGVGGRLAFARPTNGFFNVAYTDSLAGVPNIMPFAGEMSFDSADVALMSASDFGESLEWVPPSSFLR